MPDYKIDEVVDITIKRVRVAGDQGPRNTVTIIADDGGHYVMPPQATVERVAPAEWPPQPGDLWREENNGGLWFVFRDPTGSDRAPSGMRAREADGDRWTDDALNILDNGPLTLVFRDRERCPF